jgi:hypothetical protein
VPRYSPYAKAFFEELFVKIFLMHKVKEKTKNLNKIIKETGRLC